MSPRLSERAESARLKTLTTHERRLWKRGVRRVAGVDEVGAGPLAGPVVAAAVVLPPHTLIPGVDDSKKLTAHKRERLAAVIREVATAVALGAASVEEIDRLNILEAAKLAMARAVSALSPKPDHVLVDARTIPGVAMPQEAIIHGDALSQSIAAASIIAKVYRDDLMAELAVRYPGYGFERHAGYPTAAHCAALKRLGPCAIHRRTFGPVAALLGGGAAKRPARRRPRAKSG